MNHRHQLSTTATAGGSQQRSGLRRIACLAALLFIFAVGARAASPQYITTFYDGKEYVSKDRIALLALVKDGVLVSDNSDDGITTFSTPEGVALVRYKDSSTPFSVPTYVTPEYRIRKNLSSQTRTWLTLNYPSSMGGTTYIELNFEVAVNDQNFPDENFRNWVKEQEYGSDGILSKDEIAAVTEIGVLVEGISDLKGIEYFTALTALYCDNNQLTSLDVSGCTALTELYCYNNKLTSLDVSKNTALRRLYCNNNKLTSLDASGCTALTGLYCYDNKLTSLDASGCTALASLYCNDNQLTSLDVSKNTALTNLRCGYNELTSLDVSKNTALTYLSCYNNQLISLDVSKNTALTHLYCNNNKLTSLDVSKYTALTYLQCNNNQLTSLDVSKNTALTDLECNNNQLTSLDASGCTALTRLRCYENQLTSLDVSENKALIRLWCYNNQIQGAGMATLIENLPTVTSGDFYVYNTDGTDGNRITTVQVAAAKKNGWSVLTSNGDDYAGVDPGIAIDATNFPDDNFRTYVSSNCDTDKDTYLSDEEIAAVTSIRVYKEGIANLKGIEYFTALTRLACEDNQLTTLDVSKNTALTDLDCGGNQLTTLDVSKNTALTWLNCEYNQLTALNLSGCIALNYLRCGYNQLTTLDLSGYTSLGTFRCNDNQLTTLDLSGCTSLGYVECQNNLLTTIDISECTKLGSFQCNNNQLTTLDLSDCSGAFVQCYNNNIHGAGMAALINSLPHRDEMRSIYVYDNQGNDSNKMTTVQVQAAKDKGWIPYMNPAGPYPGINIPADANGDGEVNATDVATVRDYILGLDPKPFSLESANLNGDSTVDIADLAKLIQLLTE